MYVETIHSVQRFSPGYHRDNILITKGCIGRRIGIPQRIRVTTWNQAYINYTKCVKSERSYIMQIPAWKQSLELPCRYLFCLSLQYEIFERSYSQLDDRLLFVCYTPSLPLYKVRRSPFGLRLLLKIRAFREFISAADF